MPKVLSDAVIRQYRTEGYYFPLAAMSSGEAASCRRQLEAYEEAQRVSLRRDVQNNAQGRPRKLHLLLGWMNELVRHPAILDVMEDMLGPDILCWQTHFFVKEPHDPGFVSWHQDSTYWGLGASDVVTAWVALSPSNRESGCMRVIPGSHRRQVPHVDTFGDDNLLTRGQEVAVKVDERQAVDLVLDPGQISLHHVSIIHASEPNRSSDRRIGCAMRYIAPHVRQVTGIPDSALLVRGEDTHGNFELEPSPKGDFDPEAVAFHENIVARRNAFLAREKGNRPGAE